MYLKSQPLKKIVEVPHMQTIEKVVEVPVAGQTLQGAQRAVNVPLPTVRQMGPAENVTVTEIGAPLPAEHAGQVIKAPPAPAPVPAPVMTAAPVMAAAPAPAPVMTAAPVMAAAPAPAPVTIAAPAITTASRFWTPHAGSLQCSRNRASSRQLPGRCCEVPRSHHNNCRRSSLNRQSRRQPRACRRNRPP